MSIVHARALSFEFPNGHVPFTNLSFSLGPGLAALVGPNGVGKTTLVRLLAGELIPTAGKVEQRRQMRYFPQHEAPPPRSVDAYLAGTDWSATGAELLAGIDRSLTCDALSGGEWMRVRLAASLAEDYLILDEPTNDLDRPARAAVQRFLRGRDALLISHDRETLRLATEIWELSSLGLSRYGFGWNAYVRERAAERGRLTEELANAKRARETAAAEARAVQARREKSRPTGRRPSQARRHPPPRGGPAGARSAGQHRPPQSRRARGGRASHARGLRGLRSP